jgi:Arc/MetJ family transcription regulator
MDMKHLVDMDEELLARVKAILGTATLKATVDRALHIAEESAANRAEERRRLLDDWASLCAEIPLDDRAEAW